MALPIDTINGCGPSNETHSQLLPKKTKVADHITAKPFYWLYITNKMKCFTFKSGHVMQVAKRLKEDWLTVFQ